MGRQLDDAEIEALQTRRDEVRAKALASIASWYVPWLHLCVTAGIGVAGAVAAVWHLHDVRAIEWLVVPGVFTLSNAVEWRAHRNVLHRRWRPIAVLYDRHTPMHHMVFQYHDMAMRSSREFALVLIPSAGVAAVIAMLAPFAYIAGRFVTPNCGWLVLMTGSLYVMTYELTHLAYHLPPDSFIGRLSLIRVLREHHARHHDPRLMQKWNFNVTVPLFDWVYGTIAKGETLEKIGIREEKPV